MFDTFKYISIEIYPVGRQLLNHNVLCGFFLYERGTVETILHDLGKVEGVSLFFADPLIKVVDIGREESNSYVKRQRRQTEVKIEVNGVRDENVAEETSKYLGGLENFFNWAEEQGPAVVAFEARLVVES